VDAFDADCLVYAAAPGHSLGVRVAALLDVQPPSGAGVNIGSTVLVPELLSKPIREERHSEIRQLAFILSRLDLRPVDRAIASLAAVLGARHRLRAAYSIHLATAVALGADRFITNNRRDFDRDQITEIDITYPDML
jgi:predicted nucleic acid-binding protein